MAENNGSGEIGREETGGAGLRSELKQRHMTLIALGGVIGAGLFVGSGVVIDETGLAAIISFLLAAWARHPRHADAR